MGNNQVEVVSEVSGSLADPDGPSEISGEVEDFPEDLLRKAEPVEKTAEEKREELRSLRFQEFSERNGVFVEINEKLHRVLPGKSIAQILHEIEEIEFFSMCYFPGLDQRTDENGVKFRLRPELQKSCSCHVFIREDMGGDYDYEFEGLRYKFVRSCITTVRKNMVIITHQYSRMREKMRQFFEEHIINVLTLLNESHPNCDHCLYEPWKCEIHHIIESFKKRRLVGRSKDDDESDEDQERRSKATVKLEEDDDEDEEEEGEEEEKEEEEAFSCHRNFVFDPERCIGCMRCLMECEKHQGIISRLTSSPPASETNKLTTKKIEEEEGEEEEEETETKGEIKGSEEVITIENNDKDNKKKSEEEDEEEQELKPKVVDLEDFFFEKVLNTDNCVRCGQCTLVCPNAVIRETQAYPEVLSLLNKKKEEEEERENNILVLMISASSRAMFYQYFSRIFDKKKINKFQQFDRKETILVSFLKKTLGFDHVVDLSLGSDLALIETVHEFIKRVKDGGPFPFITSNCPSVVTLVRQYYPELLTNLSSVRSPSQILGAVIKKFYHPPPTMKKKDDEDVDTYQPEPPRKNIVTISIVPCTSKNTEIHRNDDNNIDYFLTTRELIQIAVQYKFAELFESEYCKIQEIHHFDFPILLNKTKDGEEPQTSRSGYIYDICGGILESVLQYLNVKDSIITHQLIRHSNVPNLDYRVTDPNVTFRAIVCHGGTKLMKLFKVLQKMKDERTKLSSPGDEEQEEESGDSDSDSDDEMIKPVFIEANACFGGCFGGGGGVKFQSKKIVLERWRFVEEMCSKKPSVPTKSEFMKLVYSRIGAKPLSKKTMKHFHRDVM